MKTYSLFESKIFQQVSDTTPSAQASDMLTQSYGSASIMADKMPLALKYLVRKRLFTLRQW